MSYLTDNPWPLIIVLLGAAAVALFVVPGRGKSVALLCAAAAALVWFVEGAIVSDTEKIEAQAQAMLNDFKNRDLDAIASKISTDSPELVDIAEQGLELVDLQPDFEVRSVEVQALSNGTATVRIRANGSGMLRSGGFAQYAPTYWATEWKHQNGQWLLSAVSRLDVVTGEVKGTFDRN